LLLVHAPAFSGRSASRRAQVAPLRDERHLIRVTMSADSLRSWLGL
jgi:hypothetical protein